MPAKSKSQQRLMGMVHAYQAGKLDTKSVNKDLLAKIKKIAGGMKKKSAKEFAETKHKGLPEVKETHKMTFKEFLVEMTQKEREALTPPPAITKLYNDLKRQNGIVKREVFLNKLADRLKLTPEGLKRLANLPAIQAMRFDDDQANPNIVSRRDPWAHVSQKANRREEMAKRAGVRW